MSLPSYQGEGNYKILYDDLIEFSVREEDIINRLALRKLLQAEENSAGDSKPGLVEEFNRN